ncbi:Arm DNA-binding domain-containing protein [Ancylobacter vacuolatus]
MAKATNKLSARTVLSISAPGRRSDGGGLNLQVSPTGAKFWLFMFKPDGKRSELGFGPAHDISLTNARQKASEARKLIDAGTNPRDERRAAEAARKAQATKLTFGEVADSLIESIAAGFRNARTGGSIPFRACFRVGL